MNIAVFVRFPANLVLAIFIKLNVNSPHKPVMLIFN